MDGKSERRVVNFPATDEYGEDGRQARVRALKKRVASGQYRLDPGAVAEAMLAEGVFETDARPVITVGEDELRRAMDHFVVHPEPPTDDGDVRAASGL